MSMKMNDGSFLIGTRGNGVLRFTASTERQISLLEQIHIRLFLQQRSTAFFLSIIKLFSALMMDYLCHLSTEHTSHSIVIFHRLKVLKLFKASDGSVWIGTYSCGLIILDVASNNFSTYESDLTKPRNNYSITTILEKNTDVLWLGTWGNGLISFDRKTKIFTKIKNGNIRFNTCVVKDIVDDGDGNLWIATFSEGLCRYSIADNARNFLYYTLKSIKRSK